MSPCSPSKPAGCLLVLEDLLGLEQTPPLGENDEGYQVAHNLSSSSSKSSAATKKGGATKMELLADTYSQIPFEPETKKDI